jgi:hypothetical protein
LTRVSRVQCVDLGVGGGEVIGSGLTDGGALREGAEDRRRRISVMVAICVIKKLRITLIILIDLINLKPHILEQLGYLV